MNAKENGKEPAYACAADGGYQMGMTKREAFAMNNYAQMCTAGPDNTLLQPSDVIRIAQLAVRGADALLNELAKEQSC